MKLMLFGDGKWATDSLRRLVDEGHTIVGLVVRAEPSDPELRPTAEGLNIDVTQPRRVNSKQFLQVVRDAQPELNVSVSYDQIVKRPLIKSAPLGFINVHSGKLPNYRGRNVINWAIMNGESDLGITTHYIDEGIDTGDVILQRSVPIAWTDSYGDVLRRAISEIPSLVTETVGLIASGDAPRVGQPDGVGCYYPRRGPGDEWLDWRDGGVDLHNKVRAIAHPGPGARTRIDDMDVVIWRAFCDPSWPAYRATPGCVVGCKPGAGSVVKTGDSTLLVERVQIDGGPEMTPTWPLGTRLQSVTQAATVR